jgi:hypothetical protein
MYHCSLRRPVLCTGPGIPFVPATSPEHVSRVNLKSDDKVAMHLYSSEVKLSSQFLTRFSEAQIWTQIYISIYLYTYISAVEQEHDGVESSSSSVGNMNSTLREAYWCLMGTRDHVCYGGKHNCFRSRLISRNASYHSTQKHFVLLSAIVIHKGKLVAVLN